MARVIKPADDSTILTRIPVGSLIDDYVSKSDLDEAWVGSGGNCNYVTDGIADEVQVNQAIASLSSGGVIRLANSLSLADEIFFGLGNSSYPNNNQWILKGKGLSTVLTQNVVGKNAIRVNNATAVNLKDFSVVVGATAGFGLLADNLGSSEIGFYNSALDNLRFEGGNPSNNLIKIINPFLSSIGGNVGVYAIGGSGVTPVVLDMNSNSVASYGHSKIGLLNIYTDSALHGLLMQSSEMTENAHFLDCMSADHIEVTGTGTNGVTIGSKVTYSQFRFIVSEGHTNGINLDVTIAPAANGLAPAFNTFYGGVGFGSAYGILCNNRSWYNSFLHFLLSGGTNSWADLGWLTNYYAHLTHVSGAPTGGTSLY